jgi:dUTP pyrophosphatase
MGLMSANGIGIMDSDFGGDEDEWRFLAFNYTKKPVTVEKGTRVAQFLIFKYEKVELEEVETLNNPTRGGIGSTGKK